MRKFVAGSAILALAISTTAHAAVFYEPFDYPTGPLHQSVNPGNNQKWYSSAPSPATAIDDRVQVVSGGLSKDGLPASVGNSVTFGDAGRTDRIYFGTNRSSGSVYYSLLLNVTDLTDGAVGGATIAGFNNTPQTDANDDTAAQPTAISGRLILKPVGTTGYQVGAGKASGTASSFAFTPVETPFALNENVLIVGRYTFNTGSTTDDVFDMWVNPSSATFADNALEPAPTISSTTLGDGGQIATFILRQTDNVVPAGIQMDELRVDTTWAHVTSNLVPEPASLGVLGAAAMSLFIRRRRR